MSTPVSQRNNVSTSCRDLTSVRQSLHVWHAHAEDRPPLNLLPQGRWKTLRGCDWSFPSRHPWNCTYIAGEPRESRHDRLSDIPVTRDTRGENFQLVVLTQPGPSYRILGRKTLINTLRRSRSGHIMVNHWVIRRDPLGVQRIDSPNCTLDALGGCCVREDFHGQALGEIVIFRSVPSSFLTGDHGQRDHHDIDGDLSCNRRRRAASRMGRACER
ncbi:hypothetical protein OF83DRAFT_804483 [Amylostereum chailletii]|nr:hypothetical protein OF83DRAFT_804483 [Amylostereum chailletii]